jgi:myosin-5
MIKKLEIKPLCNLILNKTITDTNKYQPGLTKIFFRAGMLAYLESMRGERLNAMVTVVQKNMRRKMAMKKYQAMRRAAILIQTWWRTVMAKALADRMRREAAAKRLQTAIRGAMQRRKFLDIRKAIIGLQSCKLPAALYRFRVQVLMFIGARAKRSRLVFKQYRITFGATRLQTLLRGV